MIILDPMSSARVVIVVWPLEQADQHLPGLLIGVAKLGESDKELVMQRPVPEIRKTFPCHI